MSLQLVEGEPFHGSHDRAAIAPSFVDYDNPPKLDARVPIFETAEDHKTHWALTLVFRDTMRKVRVAKRGRVSVPRPSNDERMIVGIRLCLNHELEIVVSRWS